MTMTENNEDTGPVTASPEQIQSEPDKKVNRWWLVLGCLVILLIGTGAGTFFGYRAGIRDRIQAQNDQKVMAATGQFTLGVADLEAGRFDMARKRFEYVISIDPGFPGAGDKLAEAMFRQAQALTPTPAPEPTAEPTPDLRNEEQVFSQIQQDLASQNWSAAITNIEALRNLNLEYRAIDVDGMYYIALRFYGIENILNQGQLEVGIYNLTLSERFAPLDQDAKSYRTWARMYIAAATFWGIDWEKVVTYFAEIYPALPNLRDSSGMTATERFRLASIKYGDQLMTLELYCDAQLQYQNALNLLNDSVVFESANKAMEYCANPPGQEPTAGPTFTPTLTPTPGGESTTPPPQPDVPTETPTPPTTVNTESAPPSGSDSTPGT